DNAIDVTLAGLCGSLRRIGGILFRSSAPGLCAARRPGRRRRGGRSACRGGPRRRRIVDDGIVTRITLILSQSTIAEAMHSQHS
ncbi:hypothetical protein, partial [Proteus mirabilis]|uniref:hypothetical protein n=1 Tax=Proteus mirabilis TaxID=584 RepID=UPI0019538E0A